MTEPKQPTSSPESQTRVNVEGTAYDSKAGAIVDSDGNGVIYIQGLEAWPSHLNGKRVVVSGFLRDEKFIPDPVVGADGGISQGAFGGQQVLTEATWRPAD